MSKELLETEPKESPLPLRSINQVVAYNMRRYREKLAWTQQQLAQVLVEMTSESWTEATVGAAERSWSTKRVRRFDANDLVALAAALGVTVVNLLIPPEEILADDGFVATEALRDHPDRRARIFPADSLRETIEGVSDETDEPSTERAWPPPIPIDSIGGAKAALDMRINELMEDASLADLVKLRLELEKLSRDPFSKLFLKF